MVEKMVGSGEVVLTTPAFGIETPDSALMTRIQAGDQGALGCLFDDTRDSFVRRSTESSEMARKPKISSKICSC